MNTATVTDLAYDPTAQTLVEENQETIDPTADALYVDLSDTEFIQSVNGQISRATKYWETKKLKSRRSTNLKYWIGDQVDASALRDDLEKGSDNAIFRNLETLIPIVTARVPELTVTPIYKNKETRRFAQEVQRALPTEWEVQQRVQALIGRGVRNHQINFIGVFQLGYDPDTDEFWTEEIVATDVVLSKDGSTLIKYIKDETLADLLEKFPEKKKEITQYFKQPMTPAKAMMDTPVEYVEVWTDDMVGWKLGNLVLGKMKNPHFDYVGEEVQTGEGTTQTVKYNHFKFPKKPFIFLTYFNRGVHVMDDTTLIEQAIGPQDWVNKRKRQIGMNADSTNGHWVSSGDFISKEEFDKIEGGIDEKIWLEGGLPADGLQKITGQPLPDYIYNDLIDSRAVLDNLMGTHATTRGEPSGNNTATQDIMQKDQDYGRVDGYIRDGIEHLAAEWYEYMYHLYLVYRNEETSIAIPEDDDFEMENVVFSRKRVPLVQKRDGTVIPVPMLFRVKQGSTLPKDEVSEYMRAKEMKDILSPLDYLKMVGAPNPRELTKNLLMWQEDPYSFFDQDEDIQALLQKKQMMAQQQAAPALPSPGVEGGGGGEGPTADGVSKALLDIVRTQGGVQ